MKGGSIRYLWPTSLFIVYVILLIPSSQVSFAKHFTDEKESEGDPTKKLCLQEILQSSVTKSFYPGILNNYDMLKQLDQYCSCNSAKRINERQLKQSDQLAWQFFDRKVLYHIKDQCAQQYLDREVLGLNYTVIFASHFYPLMDSLFEKKYPKMVRQLASQNSYNGRLSCLKEKVRKRCSKIQSLKLTYSCISSNIKNIENSTESSKECPGFQTPGETKISEADENFI